MSDGGFVHLHTHSDHPILRGVEVENIVKIVAEDDQQAVAVTRHTPQGSSSCSLRARSTASSRSQRIEAYVVDDYDSSNVRFHQLFLAYNNIGYRNYACVSIEETTKHFFNKYNVITFEDMASFTEGIIATSSCLSGKFSRSS